MKEHKKRRRWLVIAPAVLAVGAVVLVSVRAAVAQVYYVPTNVVAPEIPKGARILVSKLGSNYQPGDIIAYHGDDMTLLGRVASIDPSSGLIDLERNAPGGDHSVTPEDVVGRVVAQTR